MKGSALNFLKTVAAILIATIICFALTSGDKQAGLRFYWEEMREVASGKAYQGPWRMNDSEFHYVDDPSLAFDIEGNLGVVWVDNQAKNVFFQIYDPKATPLLDKPVNVSGSSEVFSWLPRIVFDKENVYILWQEIIFSGGSHGGSHGGEIFFARSVNHGRDFDEPINLSKTTAGAGKGRLSATVWDNGSFDLALAPDGSIYAVWTEYEGAMRLSRSDDRGLSFSSPVEIVNGNDKPARGPVLRVDATAALHLAWTIGDDEEAGIFYARSIDQGKTFSPTITAYRSGRHCDAPKLVVDDLGTIHLVFAEKKSDFTSAYGILYCRKDPERNIFENHRRLSGSRFLPFQKAAFPDLALDAKGRIFVFWSLYPKSKGRALGWGYTFSADGGNLFSPPAEVPGTASVELGTNGARQGSLMRRLAAYGDGKLALVHSTFNSGQSSHVWLIEGLLSQDLAD